MATGTRKDGRSSGQIRPLACEQGLLNRADGSSRFSHGQTCVLVAVYGPADVKPSREKMNRATIEVTVRPKTGLPGYRERALERTLRRSTESVLLAQLHPRTSITIVVQVMQDAGSLLSCAINGICMACIDAGLPMDGLLRAITCCVTTEGTLMLDPTTEEETAARAVISLAYTSTEPDHLVTSHMEGLLTEAELNKCNNAAQKGTQAINAFMRLSISRKLERQLH